MALSPQSKRIKTIIDTWEGEVFGGLQTMSTLLTFSPEGVEGRRTLASEMAAMRRGCVTTMKGGLATATKDTYFKIPGSVRRKKKNIQEPIPSHTNCGGPFLVPVI